MKKLISTSLIATALLTAGCTSEVQDNDLPSTSTTSLKFTGSAQASNVVFTPLDKILNTLFPRAIALAPPVMVDSNGATVTINSAWIVIKEIEFEATESADSDETDGDEVEFEGPYFVDLLSSTPTPIDTQVIPIQSIRRIKMKLEEQGVPPADAPAQLNGNSIYLAGTVNGFNFSYSADDGTEFEIGGANPVVPATTDELLVVIRTAALIEKIDLSGITANTDISSGNRVPGVNLCPLIDASANDLYDCFRKGIESQANFGKDSDGDDDLDDSDEDVK